MAYRILVVDDDKSIIKMIKDFLKMEEYSVETALDGETALRKAETQPDLIILDINLPTINGIEVCKKIRGFVNCPILFLTARIEEQDKITGLRAGGDDYIVKPFSLGELQARIEAHLWRENRKQVKKDFRYDRDLCIDYGSRQLFWNQREIELTKSEFDIVELLSTYPGQVFDREMIYERLWGFDREGDNKIVTELIRRIRNKIKNYTEKEYIETVWGCGYKWTSRK
ncbi:response regulator transcription factor [Lachnospiraceae bacterium 46-15]